MWSILSESLNGLQSMAAESSAIEVEKWMSWPTAAVEWKGTAIWPLSPGRRMPAGPSALIPRTWMVPTVRFGSSGK